MNKYYSQNTASDPHFFHKLIVKYVGRWNMNNINYAGVNDDTVINILNEKGQSSWRQWDISYDMIKLANGRLQKNKLLST